MDNANSQEYLQKIKVQVIENLKRTTFAPSVQMTDVPRDPEGMDDEADGVLDDMDEDDNPDTRYTKRRWDMTIEKDGELSDSEDEEENEANGVRRQPNGAKRRRNMMDFQNPDAVADDKDMIASGAVSARSGHSVNGAASSEDSEGETFDLEQQESLTDVEEADIEMDDDVIPVPEPAQNAADGPQEATPPDSPPTIAAAPTVPAHVVEETGNDVVDEGDTLDDPEFAKEEGRDERERGDITAEKATEVVERSES